MTRVKLYIVLLFWGISSQVANAQVDPAVAASDVKTYGLYLDKSWDSLIVAGNQYIKERLDYYYLRMRLGIAYYEKYNYSAAAKHFTKAAFFNPSDPVAAEYLYFANVYLGNDFEAKLWAERLPEARKEELGIVSHFIEGCSFDITYNKASVQDIHQVPSATVVGSQQVPESFINANLSLKHLPYKRFKIVHAFTYLNKSNLYYSRTSGLNTNVSDKVVQAQYYLSGAVYPLKGFQISAAYHQLWVFVPVSNSSGRGKSKSTTTLSNHSWSASISKSFVYFDAGYTYTASALNAYSQNQHALSLGIYPKGNLNLYLLNRLILFNESSSPDKNTLIVGETLGVKLASHCWTEANMLAGTIRNFAEYGSYIIYNDVNAFNLKAGLGLIFTLKSGIALNLRGNYYNSESAFSGTESIQNTVKYSSISLTGGISWSF